MANEIRYAGSVFKIGSDVVAKVTSFKYDSSMDEIDVTGAEDVSGSLTEKKFLTTAIEQSAAIEGIAVAGTAAAREPGQSALRTAGENGNEVTLSVTDSNGYGFDYVGYFTSYGESAAVGDTWKFSGGFRINSKTAVSPP